MARSFFTFILVLCFSTFAGAQIIDDSSIEDAQNGGYTFVEGMFVAYLADTVSPGFIRDEFRKLEIAVLDEHIKPIVISVVNVPSKETLEKLKNHKNVTAFYATSLKEETIKLEQLLEDTSLSAEEKEQIKKETAPVETFFVEFNYSINRKALKELMGEFRDVAYKIISDQPRTVTLKAEPGNEPLLMDKVEQLLFVESTAMIGTIKN
ncbi:MAG TPA: hypothetical protein DF712_18755 [Balneola sp.]|jgi:hypothetical protein|nr:hypothetical protein [Bacteroidota bacterium]HCI69986.1 hypothetical protein [Balneola sp.]HCT54490.1 hypothetical protein [Balneola sp.]|tara:strand:+ start:1063 stop:1686 length:624 start_codon:yes stop_codon:yes gene_type:complete